MHERAWPDAGGTAPSGDRPQRDHYYTVMSAFGDALLCARDADELWASTTQALAQDGPFAGAAVARAEAGGRLHLTAAAGAAKEALRGLALELGGTPASPVALAWTTGEPALDGDVGRARWLEGARAPGIGSLLAVPVREQGAVSAVLCLAAPEVDGLDEASQSLVRRLGRLLERWLDDRAQLSLLQHQALHDPLTDLPNRRMMVEHLSAALARARRRGAAVAVGMLDLDDFKPINDSCGHAAGDRLLRQLAERLRAELRGQDMLVRLGGDEFALVVGDLPAGRASAELAAALERLHDAMDEPFDLGHGRTAKVGMSLGVALYPFDGEEIDQLVRQADMAMYRAKSAKPTRVAWWQLASDREDVTPGDAAPAPYGDAAAALLDRAHGLLQEVARRYVDTLQRDIEADALKGGVFAAVAAPALQRHAEGLARHVGELLAPAAEADATHGRAEALGRVHALVGVDPVSVVQMLGRYRSVLSECLAASPLTGRERFRMMHVAEARLQDELQHELGGHGAAITAHHQLNAAPLPPHGTPWVDALQIELEALAALPGVKAAALQRTDADGRLAVEACAGEVGAELTALTRTTELAPLADIDHAGASTLVARAWTTGVTQCGPDYAHDERTGPWREPLARLGVRSLLAVPVPGPNDRPVAILAVYGAWVGQFGADWTDVFSQGLQHRWERLWRHRHGPERAPALARPLAERYRERLFGGGLTMYLQPVADMTSGEVVAAEALARLRLPGGAVLAPGTFLPVLGEVELARLFRLTLDRALDALVAWDACPSVPAGTESASGAAAAGGSGRPPQRLEVAVNLPPSTLLEPHCPGWIAEALQHHGVAPERLSLELIETEDIGQEVRQAAIRAIVDLGVRLSIDDLGSGFSSLRRLAELPFDTMKIDQALMARLIDEPLQTLTLVRSLVRLGQDLGRRVVVEGTSDPGLVEVASALGARFVQGFGIARPMPLEALPSWQAAFHMPAEPGRIRTAPGALAWHWRALRGRHLSHPPELRSCPLHGYFQQPDLKASEGARLHARFHAGTELGGAGEHLLEWLIAHAQTGATPG